jgi:hypothetical protein
VAGISEVEILKSGEEVDGLGGSTINFFDICQNASNIFGCIRALKTRFVIASRK